MAKSAWLELRSILFGSRAVRDAVIVGMLQVANQGFRFIGNIVLASLLSPAIFGLLGLITAIRTGGELLTDIGISQNIVVSDDGSNQKFVETAWGIQILRGLGLTLLGAVTAFPIAWYYGQPKLGLLLLVGSLTSVVGAVGRPGPALCLRERNMSAIAVCRLSVGLIGLVSSVALAWLVPSAMGQVIAGIIATILVSVLSFLILPLPGYRPRIDPRYRSKILLFGRWIFVSSLVYFFASNFDRLYLPSHIPIALFGIYNMSRSLAGAFTQMANDINRLVVLPTVARSKTSMATMSARLGRTRFIGLAAMNAGLGVMIAGSDILITTIFDVRYEMAAIILPILLLGCWFSIHGSLVETTLLGLGFPQPMVVGNMMRLLSTAVGLPLALSAHGLFLALIVISFADLPRYFWFTWQAFRKGVSFGGQEPTLFVMTVAIALVTRYILVHVGLVDGLLSSVQMQAIAKLL